MAQFSAPYTYPEHHNTHCHMVTDKDRRTEWHYHHISWSL